MEIIEKGKSLKNWLAELNQKVINSHFPQEIIERSKSYVNHFYDVEYQEDKISGKVIGSEIYKLKIKEKNGNINGKCDCPYGFGCKHMAAFLAYLALINKEISNQLPETGPEFSFENYVNSLSIDALKTLVIKFAPQKYREKIKNQHSSANDEASNIHKIKQNIEKILEYIDDAYDSEYYEKKILQQLDKIDGMSSAVAIEVYDIFINIITSINDAIDQGYLYNHYSDTSFEGFEIGARIFSYYSEKPKEIKEEYILKLLLAENNIGDYALEFDFLNLLFNKCDLETIYRLVCKYLEEGGQVYDREIETLVNKKQEYENDQIFFELIKTIYKYSDNNLTIKYLLSHYKETKQYLEAVHLLEKKLKDQKFISGIEIDHYFQELILLKQTLKSNDLEIWCIKYFEKSTKAQTLAFIRPFLADESTALEKNLEKEALHEYLEFLMIDNRIEEVNPNLEMFEKKHKQLYDQFILKYMKTWPEKAKTVLYLKIEKATEYTGEGYYNEIILLLQKLKKIEHTEVLKTYVNKLKSHFSRRRNFIEKLNKFS